jgi:hypothetical protein
MSFAEANFREMELQQQLNIENMRVRAEITTQGIRGLLLINGGGAAALLAFLQAVWNQDPRLANYVVTAIAWLAAGVSIAGVSFFLRYHTSFAFDKLKVTKKVSHYKAWKAWSHVSVASWYVSLAMFIVGLSWVVRGAWDLLETVRQSTLFT